MICMLCECWQLMSGSILRSLNHQGGLSGREREKNTAAGNTRHAREGKNSSPLVAFPLASFASDIARNRSALFIKSFAFIDGDKSCQQSCRLLYFIVIYFALFYYCRGKQIYHKIYVEKNKPGRRGEFLARAIFFFRSHLRWKKTRNVRKSCYGVNKKCVSSIFDGQIKIKFF